MMAKQSQDARVKQTMRNKEMSDIIKQINKDHSNLLNQFENMPISSFEKFYAHNCSPDFINSNSLQSSSKYQEMSPSHFPQQVQTYLTLFQNLVKQNSEPLQQKSSELLSLTDIIQFTDSQLQDFQRHYC